MKTFYSSMCFCNVCRNLSDLMSQMNVKDKAETSFLANYGAPVRSTSYGVIEIKGWNRYGGWRIGIRGNMMNAYHPNAG